MLIITIGRCLSGYLLVLSLTIMIIFSAGKLISDCLNGKHIKKKVFF